jgi:hypothetical protein
VRPSAPRRSCAAVSRARGHGCVVAHDDVMLAAVPRKPRVPRPTTFRTTLWRYPGPSGWTFARIPDAHAPPATHPWGRTPVVATVDGTTWQTSVWRDKKHGTLLAVPKKIRGAKGDGDVVEVALVLAEPP